MYRAKFETSIPNKPIKFAFGKWFLDIRFLKWQILVNKMTKQQVETMKLSFEWEEHHLMDTAYPGFKSSKSCDFLVF